MIACIHCGHLAPTPPRHDIENLITVACGGCGKRTPTGREETVRRAWEDFLPRDYPAITAARAIALSNAIYTTAETGTGHLDIDSTEAQLHAVLARRGQVSTGMTECALIDGRSHRGYTDPTTVGAVAVMGNGHCRQAQTIYVIFRGSRARAMAETDPCVDVDWRANFDNRLEHAGFGSRRLRIHRGFADSLSSYRLRMLCALDAACERHPSANIVITGHSQGGAHAILFAHWLAHRRPGLRFLCIPFSPPRVGNFAFARDFTNRIARRRITLPFDGRTSGAFLMVKGRDPVVFGMRRAFLGRSDDEGNAVADSFSLLRRTLWAFAAERRRAVPWDVYFHPKMLTRVTSLIPKFGLLAGLDHHPRLFRDRILQAL